MANRKISDLTALTAPATGDLLPIVDISEAAAADKNKKITYGNMFTRIPSGIGFPATQVASADANTLDDYEEGTWTPTVTPEGGSITSFTASQIRYTKIGNVAHIECLIKINNQGSAAGNYLNLGGLPFAIAGMAAGAGQETSVTGKTFSYYSSGNTLIVSMYDFTIPAINNYNLPFSFSYIVA